MPHQSGYRTIATRHDGFRAIIAEGLPKETAEKVATGMADMGYAHKFIVECAECADAANEPPPDAP
jgi:hypothetical protein